MSTTDMSRTVDILRSLYQHVQTLEEFTSSLVFREGQRAALIEQSDTHRFKSFIRGVYVCFDKELQQVPSCNQVTFPLKLLTGSFLRVDTCFCNVNTLFTFCHARIVML